MEAAGSDWLVAPAGDNRPAETAGGECSIETAGAGFNNTGPAGTVWSADPAGGGFVSAEPAARV